MYESEEIVGEQAYNRSEKAKIANFRRNGQTLYLSFILNLITGSYRLLPIKDFKFELWIGYSMELFLNASLAFC